MWIASCTKLLTSLAALQCVERGLLTKDGDISQAHPDLAPLGKMKVLQGFNDDGSPNLVDNTKPITLTHLLSHSSGLAYAGFDPEIQAVYKHNNKRFDVITPTFVCKHRFSALIHSRCIIIILTLISVRRHLRLSPKIRARCLLDLRRRNRRRRLRRHKGHRPHSATILRERAFRSSQDDQDLFQTHPRDPGRKSRYGCAWRRWQRRPFTNGC